MCVLSLRCGFLLVRWRRQGQEDEEIDRVRVLDAYYRKLHSGNKPSQSGTTPSSGLFGSPAPTTSQPQSGNLFSGAGSNTGQTQQQPIGSSLFGGGTAAQQPQQQSGGLFGGLSSATNTQQSGGGTSLFGGANQQGQTGGPFGNPPQKTAGTGPSPFSLGGASQAQNKPSMFGGTLGQNTSNQPTSGGLL